MTTSSYPRMALARQPFFGWRSRPASARRAAPPCQEDPA